MALNENAAFFLTKQTDVVPLAIGDPGVAKTRTTEAFARSVKRKYECVIGSHFDPADITGYPHISEAHGEKCQSFAKTEWRVNLEHSPTGGLLHLDELTDCAPAVQAAMLQLLTHGVRNSWICATANPSHSGTNAYDLAPTTVNRLCVLDWKTPIRSWQEGMLCDFQNHVDQFPILPEKWQTSLQTARALVVSFTTKVQMEMAQQLPKDVSKRGSPWPSLRSWTNAATLLAAAESIHAPADMETELIQGCVGDGCALAFLKWRKTLDLPDPEELLANPKLYKPSSRGDISHVVLSSVVGCVLRNNNQERWDAAWEVIGLQCDVSPDIAATAAPALTQNKPTLTSKTPEGVRKKLLPILQALT